MGRGSALVQLGKYQEAVADAQTALDKRPVTPGTLYNAASIYAGLVVQLGHDPEAAVQFKKEAPVWTAEAVRLLTASLEQSPPDKRPFLLNEFKADRTFDSIRDLPELKRSIAQMRETLPATQ